VRRVRRVIGAVAAAVIAITVAGVGVQALTPPGSGGIPLSAVPQGVSAHDIAGRPVFLVRHGRKITGFLRTSPFAHTALVWCTAEDLFMAPAWGERFDITGRAMNGHVSRHMDRVRVVVGGSTVRVDATAVTPGSRPTVQDRRQAIVDWVTTHDRPLPIDYCSPTIPS
jgi:hypothetical protein